MSGGGSIVPGRRGMVDIHAHILPGIDDGPRDMASAVEMARAAVASGTAVLCATPHLRSDFPNVHVGEIAERCEELRRELAAAEIPLELVSGAECSLVWALEADDEQLRMASYGGRGTDLLIETPRDVSMLEPLLSQVAVRGFRIVLAHPERSYVLRDPQRIAAVCEHGVIVQINAASVLAPRRRSKSSIDCLRAAGASGVIASDGHRAAAPRPVGELGAAVDALTKSLGREHAAWLTSAGPRAIATGSPVEPFEPGREQRKGWLRRR